MQKSIEKFEQYLLLEKMLSLINSMVYYVLNLGRFVAQMHKLSSIFGCDQIYKYFGHTLFCYLSRTYMFNNPPSVLTSCKVSFV